MKIRDSEENRRLYVGNLNYAIDEAELRRAFQLHVEVDKVEIVKDRDTGRSKGFGFVTLCASSDMDKAIAECGEIDLRMRKIRVERATPRNSRSIDDYRRDDATRLGRRR